MPHPFEIEVVDGTKVLCAISGASVLSGSGDARPILEACFESGARAILLDASNLPDEFFDLSSGVAGQVLQKLRTYGGMRLAVIDATAPSMSTHFRDMELEERRKGQFGLFPSREAARAWLVGE